MDNNEVAKPVAARVAENVKMLRTERGFDLADVAHRMAELGRPLSLNGVSKVERGKRGVDVDDLVALALALDVTPNRLLLAPGVDGETLLAPAVVTSERSAWQWATGEHPLPDSAPDDDHRQRFRDVNRPHGERATLTVGQLRGHRDVLAPLLEAARVAEEAGVPAAEIPGLLDMARAIGLSARPMLASQSRAEADDGER